MRAAVSKHRVGLILRSSGRVSHFETVGEYPTLGEMQAAVGGYIERIHLLSIVKGMPEPCIMLVNEDGLLKHLIANQNASALARMPIVGDVIVMPARLFK